MRCERAGCEETLDPILGAASCNIYHEVLGYTCPVHEWRWFAIHEVEGS